jgi:hypothetical protein
MTSMRAMVVKRAGGDFELEEREVPEPEFDQALVRVHACGVCHSDMFAKEGSPASPPHHRQLKITDTASGTPGASALRAEQSPTLRQKPRRRVAASQIGLSTVDRGAATKVRLSESTTASARTIAWPPHAPGGYVG